MTQASLLSPASGNPLEGFVVWSEFTFFGSMATLLCILAVAILGLQLLSGRLELGRGIRTLIGVVVVLSAPAIAASLVAFDDRQSLAAAPAVIPGQPPARELPPVQNDPYAGASLRR